MEATPASPWPTTKVGDRYVLEQLRAGGFALGGEQSGHVIQRDLATTGDGLLAGGAWAGRRRWPGTDEPLADLAAVMTRLPQVLRNVRLAHRPSDLLDSAHRRGHHRREGAGGDGGRVLLRPSGTEPVVRVMVEAPTERPGRGGGRPAGRRGARPSRPGLRPADTPGGI